MGRRSWRKLEVGLAPTEAWSQGKLLPQPPSPEVELMGGIKMEPTAKRTLLRESTTNWERGREEGRCGEFQPMESRGRRALWEVSQ